MADLKQTWSDNPALRAGTAGVLVLAAATLIYVNFPSGPSASVPRPWALSLSSGELVDVETPAEISSTPDLVEVVVMSCGGCGGIEQGMTESQARDAGASFAYLKKPREGGGSGGPGDQLVASAAAPTRWMPMFSPMGRALQEANLPECPDEGFPDLCTP